MKKPVPQLGGKTFSASLIEEIIPYHTVYVEVFGGGASLLFNKNPSYVEIYNDIAPSAEAKILIDKIRLAKDCNDINVPIVEQWNLYLKEALHEPEGSREYLKFI